MDADEVEHGSAAQGPVAAAASAGAAAPSATPAPAAPAAPTAATATVAPTETAAVEGATLAAKRRTGTAPSTSFKGCQPALSQDTLEVVQEMGFESMTPVQVRLLCFWDSSFGASRTAE